MCTSCRRRSELRSDRYSIIERFADSVRFSKKILRSTENSASVESIWRHALLVWVHCTHPGKEALKVVLTVTQLDLIFNAVLAGHERMDHQNGIARDTPIKTFQEEQMTKPGSLKYDRYQVQSNKLTGWAAVAILLERRYGQNLLISENVGRFMMTGKESLPQTGHRYFKYQRGQTSGHFVIMSVQEGCTI